MTDHTNLIARLRSFGGFANEMEITDEAADALEALQATVTRMHDSYDLLMNTTVDLRAEVEQLKHLHRIVENEWQDRFDAAQARLTALEGQTRYMIEGAWCAGYYDAGYTNDSAYAHKKATECADELLAAGAAPTKEQPRFPTMLRKMWSGSEVQDWINANWDAPRKDSKPHCKECATWTKEQADNREWIEGVAEGKRIVEALAAKELKCRTS